MIWEDKGGYGGGIGGLGRCKKEGFHPNFGKNRGEWAIKKPRQAWWLAVDFYLMGV